MSRRRSPSAAVRAAAECHRPDGAVEFRNGDHHGGLDRRQAARIACHCSSVWNSTRMGRDIGHVERREHVLGGFGIIVGRAANQRKSGQRNDRVDDRRLPLHEVTLDRRPRVETAGESGNHAQSLGLKRGDDAVIVRRRCRPAHRSASSAARPRRCSPCAAGVRAVRDTRCRARGW